MEQEYEIRNKHMLVVAGGLGVLAVIMVMWNEWRIRHENDQDMIRVMVAKKDLTQGKKLSEADIDIVPFPAKLVPADYKADIIQETDKNAAFDLELNQDVAVGRIMRFSYLRGAAKGLGNDLVPQAGYRLVAVPVNKGTCPPGLRPGMWVDVRARRPTGVTWVMDRVLVKTVNGIGALSSQLHNVDSVGLEVRSADADDLSAFLMTNADEVILYTRNPAEDPDPTHKAADGFKGGFNPELKPGHPAAARTAGG